MAHIERPSGKTMSSRSDYWYQTPCTWSTILWLLQCKQFLSQSELAHLFFWYISVSDFYPCFFPDRASDPLLHITERQTSFIQSRSKAKYDEEIIWEWYILVTSITFKIGLHDIQQNPANRLERMTSEKVASVQHQHSGIFLEEVMEAGEVAARPVHNL